MGLNRSVNGSVYSTSPEYIGLLTNECYFRVGSNCVVVVGAAAVTDRYTWGELKS